MDERPTTEDLLERGEFIRRLGNALVKDDDSRATGVVVGITGEWGSGKSSILKMAATHLEEKRSAIVISFDPWIISGRDDLIERLLIQIATRLGLRKEKWAKKLGKSVAGYVEALGPAIDALKLAANVVVPGSGAVAGGLAKIIGGELGKTLDIHQQREELKAALEKAKVAIIVMIDEIDRLDDAEIRAVAQFVRAVADFDRISYLLAYDQKRVAEALGGGTSDEHRARGTAYLEKIVQYQIPLPLSFGAELQHLAKRDLSTILPPGWDADKRWEELESILIPGILNTPRDIKRFTGMAQILFAMAGEDGIVLTDEVDRFDLLGWSALLTKAPHITEIIREKPYLVGGPALSIKVHIEVMLTLRKSEDFLKELIPDNEKSSPIASLLRFLFPTLDGHSSTKERHSDCICFARPLLTVLRYGIPLEHFSRADINAFLKADSKTRQRTLAKAMDDGLFDPFHIRLAEIYPSAPGLDHAQLWRDIAAFLNKAATPWPAQPTPCHRLHRKFFDTMVETGIRHHHEVIRVGLHNAYTALDTDGDWQMLPTMLNTQLWCYGLPSRNRSDSRLPFLSEIQTGVALNEFKARMKKEFLADSDIVGRLRSIDALFIMVDAESWSKECRNKMTRLLSQPRILDSLILLFFYGDLRLDKSFFEKLFDFSTYHTEVERRIVSGLDNCHPTLAALYSEIRATGLPRP